MKYRIFILLIIAFSFFISCDSSISTYAKDFGESGDRTICGVVTDVDTGLSIEEAKILIYFRDVTFGGYETLDLLTTTFTEPSGFFLRTFYTDGAAGSNEWYLLVCRKEEYKNDTIKFSDDDNHYFTIKLEKE